MNEPDSLGDFVQLKHEILRVDPVELQHLSSSLDGFQLAGPAWKQLVQILGAVHDAGNAVFLNKSGQTCSKAAHKETKLGGQLDARSWVGGLHAGNIECHVFGGSAPMSDEGLSAVQTFGPISKLAGLKLVTRSVAGAESELLLSRHRHKL